MKQKAHTWIALRAIGLLQNDWKTKKLASILSPYARESCIGCWLPDMSSFKKGHGYTNNHTFKCAPYNGENPKRFIVKKNKLLNSIDKNLMLYSYIKNKSTLTSGWWSKPYKAIQSDGDHLPDTISSLCDTIYDMLLLGDSKLEKIIPGKPGYLKFLGNSCALSSQQVSMFFFILSHYVADCFMPCHSDKRKLSSFNNGKIHGYWEKRLDNKIGIYFSKHNILKTKDNPNKIIKKAQDMDDNFGLLFPSEISWGDLKNDIWQTSLMWCRASFAFCCDIFPVSEYPYDSKKTPYFSEILSNNENLGEYEAIILQSAVYAVASVWKKIWSKFK